MKEIGGLFVVFALASLFMVGVVGLSQSYAQEDESVVGLWLFDEGKGKVASDSSGNKNDGDILGGPKWVEGKFDMALRFDGVDDFVKIASSETIKSTSEALTVEFWIYPTDAANQGNMVEINGNSGWRLRYLTGNGLKIYDRANTNSIVVQNVAPLNTWTHVAATGDDDGLKLYANGEEIGATNTTFAPILGGDHLTIGTSDNFNEYFKGIIDEVRILNRPLTQDEIQSSMRGLGRKVAVEPSGKLAAVWGQIKVR